MKRKPIYGQHTTATSPLEKSLDRILFLSERIKKREKENEKDRQLLKKAIELIQKNNAASKTSTYLHSIQPFFRKEVFGWNLPYNLLSDLYSYLNRAVIDATTAEDFKLAFTGEGEQKNPIICKRGKVRMFIDVLAYLQMNNVIPDKSLVQVISDRCISQRGKIPQHNIESDYSASKRKFLKSGGEPLYNFSNIILSRLKRKNSVLIEPN